MAHSTIVRGAVNPPRRGVHVVEQPLRQQPETKRQRFVRLVNGRLHTIFNAFDEFSKLADRDYYEFAPSDVEVIVEALRAQVDRIEQSFTAGKKLSIPLIKE